MSGQKKISSFFTTKVSMGKRTRPFTGVGVENESNTKILKQTTNHMDHNPKAKVVTFANCGFMTNTPNSMDASWKRALKQEFDKPYYQKLERFVQDERSKCVVYPPEDQVFSWMQHCSIRDVKVVILGQDPYHGPGQAHGLCFSVQKGVASPPSLVNIFNELKNDIKGFSRPDHGDLTEWAKQGVLLLNAVLTVRASQANSHKDKGWETFTDSVISWLNTNLKNVVFILWGGYAQKKGARINTKRHLVLKAVHPSPLSAYRGFFGCKHFSKANDYLKKHSKPPVNWNTL